MQKERKPTGSAARLDQEIDTIVEMGFRATPPDILYHYTTWEGIEGILSSQVFRAFAHNHMKDRAELQSANPTILQVARDVGSKAKSATRKAFGLFIENYPKYTITDLRTVYLSCFSAARDDRDQWREYGDNGRGVCLGIRLLPEYVPDDPDLSWALLKVDYSEDSWAGKVEESFRSVRSLLHRFGQIGSKQRIELAMVALYRIAAKAAICAKLPQWEVEQEFRIAAFIRDEVRGFSRVGNSNGRPYVTIKVRAGDRRIALAEVLVGPNGDSDSTERLEHLFEDNGYAPNDAEYPKILRSAHNRLA